MSRAIWTIVGLFVAGFTSHANAQLPRVPDEISRFMQNRQFAEAVEAIGRAEGAEGIDQDYLLYLKGRAYHFNEQYDEAIAAFDAAAKKYPDSRWSRRGRFAKGASFARKGDFRSAELVYRTEAQYLLSLDRKQEIADIYLEFADAFFKPASEDQSPDYRKALEFYDMAIRVGPLPAKQIEIELLMAQCYQQLGEFDAAISRFNTFIKDHLDDPRAVEARFRLGQCFLDSGKHDEARRTWQDLVEIHATSDSVRVPEAMYRLASTHNLPVPDSDDELNLGVTALRRFLSTYPEHELAPVAQLEIGRSYHHRSRFADAVTALDALLAEAKYAGAKELPEAQYLLGHAYKMQGKFDEAVTTWREFLAKYPTDKAWSNAQREIIETEFAKAESQFTAKQFDEARRLWSEFLVQYPLDGRNRQILFRFGQMNYDSEKWDEALDDWRRLVTKYPQSNEASYAQLLIASTLEEKLSVLDEALKEYRKLDWGPYQNAARQRIARLTAKSLRIESERVFRGNEAPHLKLETRNIASVTVRVYAIDLETYFRKMHLAGGISELDIALIDPDRTFEFEIKDYAPYQEFSNEVEVDLAGVENLGGGRVTAVTVASATLEATTLVLRSDLDIVVKSSRDELFVFAQNMRTGEPWPGARVLVSDGSKVFAEATTGSDGVLQQSHKELSDAQDIRVFAIADSHAASNVVGLDGLNVAKGLISRGYLYTDRPAYRPGQVVHVRGILRQVDGDVFTVAKDKKYTVEVFDTRDRSVFSAEVQLNDFGSFHTHFLLPDASPQGGYRVMVHDNQKESYQGSFAVHEYQLEPIRIEIDTERTVVYRGEEIEGRIRAEYYYGAPLVNRNIQYRIADGRWFTAKTDARGEVAFSLPTRDYRESQALNLLAVLPERNLGATRTFFVSTQEYSLAASTVRSVYLSGESFEISVRAVDPEGKPQARKLELEVIERTEVQGKIGESIVQTVPLETNADGDGRATIHVDEGGQYALRVSGGDRFDNVVTAETRVRISDDKDSTRLRILADRHTYKVGDTDQITLHWREEPALALITMEGARILEYRLVRLNAGINRLDLEVTEQLAPNFNLAVAVMTDPAQDSPSPSIRFHESSSPFVVERKLNVAIDIREKDGRRARPGEALEVVVTTTDTQGKPISAEISLAMIEQSLLEQYGRNWVAADTFFRGARREPAIRTTSSIKFTDQPITRPIDARLLAEADRIAVEAEERERLEALAVGGEGVVAGVVLGLDERPPAADLPATTRPFVTSIVPVIDEAPENGVIPQRAMNWAMQRPAGAYADADGLGFEPSFRFDQSGNSHAMFRGAQTQDVKLKFTHQFGADRFSDWVDAFDVPVLASDGVWRNLAFEANNPRANRAMWEQAVAEGATPLPQLRQHETAYWNPSIVTGDEGTASLTITLPQRSTEWTLLAKGITAGTLAGEAEGKLAVSKPLFGQLKLPPSFTSGDEAKIGVTVHNDLVDTGKIQVELAMTIGEKTTTLRQEVDVKEKGILDFEFPQSITLLAEASRSQPGAEAKFQLSVSAGDQTDIVHRQIPIRPDGLPVYAIKGGSATGDVTAIVEPPADLPIAEPSLQIIVGPTIEQSLLDVVFGTPTWCQVESSRVSGASDTLVGDLMASLALQKLMTTSRDAGNPQSESLDARIRMSVAALVAAQNDDGGWSWTSHGGDSDPYHSARVVWSLTLAKAAGYAIHDQCAKSFRAYLANQIAAAPATDYESKSILLHALTAAGFSDFPLANQLYRNRNALSSAGLAHLSLTFADMDRVETAGELASQLGRRTLDEPASRGSGNLAWNQSTTELRALYALALSRGRADQPALRTEIDWLMAHRTGHRWAPEKATGPAMLAIADWFARTRFDGETYKLAVFVNNLLAKEIEIDSSSVTQTIDVPPEFLADDKQRVRFQLNGRGRFTYQCVLGGFVSSEQLKSTTKDWRVVRHFEPAPLEIDGREIERGFSTLQGSYRQFRNDLNELPVGRRGRVELRVNRDNVPANTRDEQLEYLVVTEPLPAGTTVIENSVAGEFERYEIVPGAIVFYLGSRHRNVTLSYEIHGYLAGQYRATPTVVRNAYRMDQIAVAAPKSITVLPMGAKSSDPYRLTPDELLQLGRHHFDKGEFPRAAQYLGPLFKEWNLDNDSYRDTVRMLLDVHLAEGPAAEVVRYFEIIVEKYPDLEVSFAKLLQAGDAYHEIGEYERSYLVFRAAVEASFMRESRVAGFLRNQNEFARSVGILERLLNEYPPEPYSAAATYALAQQVYAKAPTAAADEKLRQSKITRVDLIRNASDMLDGFLTDNPLDPAADEAAFSLASALLDLDLFEKTIARCREFATRYPDSKYLDSYWYITGYCHFARGEHNEALRMCNQVADTMRRDPATGRDVESPNKWEAVYILGQIFHSLGRAEDAIREYTRVEDRFADARQAIQYFARRRLELPEVTTLAPGKPVSVELAFRNLPECRVRVYRIDLMKFGLLRRDLSEITRINLAGIRPLHESNLDLGSSKDYRDRTRALALPMTDEGAYLVVCRSEDLYASGLILISPLSVEVQEDPRSGRVRTTVRDTISNQYANDVHVKVIGTRNAEFQSGETDLRGIFVADEIKGRSMIIAQADRGRYAFYRGQVELGPPPPPPANAAAQQVEESAPDKGWSRSSKEQLLENLKGGNSAIQVEQQEQLDNLFDNRIEKGIGGGFGGGIF